MTRFLSESLQADEPNFSLGLKRLESISGNQAHDIRLTADIIKRTQDKLKALGLDPHDTTAEELYMTLSQKAAVDDAKLVRTLRTLAAKHVSAEADAVAGMTVALKRVSESDSCYALKSTRLRALIKKQPPKKAMQRLGYRSLESFLKHEPPSLILAAARLCENETWQQHFRGQYMKLRGVDFEVRKLSVVMPESKRWQELSRTVVMQQKHNVLSLKELGTIVLLPLPNKLPTGAVTVSLCCALHELNEIRSSSTFLKLCQVRPDFGKMVSLVSGDEAKLNEVMFDTPMPWNLIQHYYARFKGVLSDDLSTSHLHLDDMTWSSIEHSLSQIEPSLNFWRGSAHLGLLEGHRLVSLNIVDAALNLCNKLSFENRAIDSFKRALWHELLLRYLSRDKVEQTVLSQLLPAKRSLTSVAI